MTADTESRASEEEDGEERRRAHEGALGLFAPE